MPMNWKITQVPKKLPKLNKPIFIEGLPGIGNVGKVTIDFIREELKGKKLFDLFSYTFPHSVFVNDKNMVELPTIEIYYAKNKKNDLLLLVGDVQPIDEVSSYEFCDAILKIVEKFKCQEIITLGGIGLQAVPENPKVYCTSNSKEIVAKYKKGTKLNNNLYGIVGPIVGVTGLLIGMSDIPGIAILAETFGHPMYLGIKGAKGILQILDKKLGLKLNMKKLDKEISSLEQETVKKTGDMSTASKQSAMKKLQRKIVKEIDYIG